MALEFELEKLEDVDERFRGLYDKTDDGKYLLVESLKSQLDNSGLISALEKERKAAKAANGLLKGWKVVGESPDEIKERLTELEEAATKGTDGKVQFDKWKTEYEAKTRATLENKDGEIVGMQTALNKYLIESQATAALTALGGNVKMLRPHILNQAKVINDDGEFRVRIVDPAGDAVGDGKGGYLDISGLVAGMKNDKDFAGAFAGKGTTGSGSTVSGAKLASSGTGAKTAIEKITNGLNIR